MRISLAPVIADSISKDIAVAIEAGGCDGTSNFWIAFQSVFCVLVPEMKGAVTPSGAECTMHRVE